MKFWLKLDRIAAWILFFGMTLYFISGYGMTKGIFDQSLAAKIHLDWLSVVITIAFVIHAGFATRLAFIRWQSWQWPAKFVWAAFFLSFLLGFIYLDQFYQPTNSSVDSSEATSSSSQSSYDVNNTSSGNINTSDSATSSSTSSSSDSASSSTSTATKTNSYNASTLAKYNGQNGNPAYLAVDGKVYDLTSVFQNGKHFSHYAGQELTNAFYSYHAARVLAKYPVVGTYQP